MDDGSTTRGWARNDALSADGGGRKQFTYNRGSDPCCVLSVAFADPPRPAPWRIAAGGI
jgi:hypothetical protein